MERFDLLIQGASEVVTCAGSGRAEEMLAPLRGASIGITGNRIAWIGVDPQATGTMELDAAGGFVGPGFVDCHTHVVFAGDRSGEFEQRCQGTSYLEIAQAGGGIARTVTATRAATEEQLIELALPRLERLLRHGAPAAAAEPPLTAAWLADHGWG